MQWLRSSSRKRHSFTSVSSPAQVTAACGGGMLLVSMVALLTLESAGATSGYAKACLVGDNLNTTVRY